MRTSATTMLIAFVSVLGCGWWGSVHLAEAGTPPRQAPSAPAVGESFSLVVLGEIASAGEPARPQLPDREIPTLDERVTRALDAARTLSPDLVMTTGNLLSAPQSTVRWVQQLDALDAAMDGIGAAWYPVPGVSSITDASGTIDPERLSLYAERIGPRRYAFEHRFALLIALDTHDGGPGLVSDDQVAWLGEALANSDASRVLVFTHRDLWNEQGSAWQRVHAVLAGDGRPATVFASSNRAYRQDEARDGVAYYTLGPVTGRSSEPQSESYSWPHLTLVRVRPDGVEPVVIPTNPAPDRPGVRPADWQSGEEVDRVRMLARGGWASITGLVGATPRGTLDGTVVVSVSNPTDRPLPYSVSCTSSVSAAFSPERVDGTLAPHETLSWNLSVSGGALSDARPDDHVRVGVQHAMDNGEIARLVERVPLPVRLVVPSGVLARSTDPGLSSALQVNGRSAIEADIQLPPTFTLECWTLAEEPRERTAVCSTIDLSGGEDGAGIFWMFDAEGNPMPSAVVRVAGKSVVLSAAEPWSWDRWGHLAVTHDGERATLFVNGQPVDQKPLARTGAITRPTLVIGASPGEKRPTMWYRGLVDEVRVSEGARYVTAFTPRTTLDADDATRALYHFDATEAPIGADASGSDAHGWAIGSPKRAERSEP
ncbi:MAG: LamG-like jellyroll fold domain-containing protein [Phycisphaerales bacterium]